MPKYDFHCSTCGYFEYSCSQREVRPAITCPTCGSQARRLYTPAGHIRNTPVLTHVLDRTVHNSRVHAMLYEAPTTTQINANRLHTRH